MPCAITPQPSPTHTSPTSPRAPSPSPAFVLATSPGADGALRSACAAGDRQALSANGLLGNQLTAPHSARSRRRQQSRGGSLRRQTGLLVVVVGHSSSSRLEISHRTMPFLQCALELIGYTGCRSL
ncbi:unnamed protein product [Pleuronectes platessa]|uniref:Uncharacterized protein n=1 Tax=Pleuronectes platessa TaxID=8262 RepID=A0A9N7U199_PLEPL|nr:unnamed protein product [Pleuronectes platessa]